MGIDEPTPDAVPGKPRARRKWLWALAGFVTFGAVLNTVNPPEASPGLPAPQASSARAGVPVSPLTREQRVEACLERMTFYREMGVWTVGGEKPHVRRSAWNELSSKEQDEIFHIGGCLATGGEPREVIVTVVDDDSVTKREIDTRRVSVR